MLLIEFDTPAKPFKDLYEQSFLSSPSREGGNNTTSSSVDTHRSNNCMMERTLCDVDSFGLENTWCGSGYAPVTNHMPEDEKNFLVCEFNRDADSYRYELNW